MERSMVPSMDLSKPSTHANLEAAFGGESMANRKYLFFSEVAKQLGHRDLAKLFRKTAAQGIEHAFTHSACCALNWWSAIQGSSATRRSRPA